MITIPAASIPDAAWEGTLKVVKLTSAAGATVESQAITVVTVNITALGGAGLNAGNYARSAILTITGTGFGAGTTLEIVDSNGATIVGVSAITAADGLTITPTLLTLAANAAGWDDAEDALLDTPTALGRRVRVTTAAGGVALSSAATGFTVSATPTVLGTVDLTFAGGGYDAATDTYTKANGDLVIGGTNLRGVKTIELLGAALGTAVVGGTLTPAAGWYNAAGTVITIPAASIPVGVWDGSARVVKLTSAAGATVESQAITVVTP